eukprot:TRINITY_DN53459_c0_g1_i1.p1 TRINITY_DN53459_c0_g1~~TRINITY_DN53459_c0_g1_i1.p1  ORF type:complete len:252 (+),score=44.05 TRINITY_DN53459_c0_g1_i1:229-984(+)
MPTALQDQLGAPAVPLSCHDQNNGEVVDSGSKSGMGAGSGAEEAVGAQGEEYWFGIESPRSRSPSAVSPKATSPKSKVDLPTMTSEPDKNSLERKMALPVRVARVLSAEGERKLERDAQTKVQTEAVTDGLHSIKGFMVRMMAVHSRIGFDIYLFLISLWYESFVTHLFGSFAILDAILHSNYLQQAEESEEDPITHLRMRMCDLPDYHDDWHTEAVSYTHLRAHETPEHLVCRLLLEKKNSEGWYFNGTA